MVNEAQKKMTDSADCIFLGLTFFSWDPIPKETKEPLILFFIFFVVVLLLLSSIYGMVCVGLFSRKPYLFSQWVDGMV